ncbi:MAG: hypothetical protein HY340_00065 [Candidatus Kerfeldbacteria bacterium]|nr:hypothetical protein [Candidatus Kerfeldbacteria bacterium]
MAKFVDRYSRGKLVVVLSICSLVVFCGSLVPLLKHQPGEWFIVGTTVLQIFVALVIMGVGFLLSLEPTVEDLLEAAKKQIKREKKMLRAYEDLQERRLTFKEMKAGSKALFLFFSVTGAGFVLYGLAELFHLIPGDPSLPVAGEPGTRVPIPRWSIVLVAMLMGFICYVLTKTMTFQVVSKWDESLKKFLKDIGAE